MYEVEISIVNTAANGEADFEPATAEFVRELQNLPDVDVRTQLKKVPGTRGVIVALTGIVVAGAKAGAFSALYKIAKDLYERYMSAEVELKFQDGSTLKLKNLSHSEAERIITEHLARSAKP
jgi:hypothetical protein